jgi:hypothetical protein
MRFHVIAWARQIHSIDAALPELFPWVATNQIYICRSSVSTSNNSGSMLVKRYQTAGAILCACAANMSKGMVNGITYIS